MKPINQKEFQVLNLCCAHRNVSTFIIYLEVIILIIIVLEMSKSIIFANI